MMTIDPHGRQAPFKNRMGKYFTKAMFVEHYDPNIKPVFTMKEFDWEYEGVTYPSFSRLFLEVGDPTGYLFAKEYLKSYKHFQELQKGGWFREYLDEILEELEIAQKAMGYKKIAEIATGETGSAYNAAKFLAKEGFEGEKTTGKKPVGRPSKTAKERNSRIQDSVHSRIEDDMQRILN